MSHLKFSSALVLAVASLICTMPAWAFSVYPFGVNQASKWGSNTIGTPGGVVTWSLMPDGTSLDASVPSYIQGTSNLTGVFNQVGGQAAAVAMIQSAFNSWSAVANVQFSYVSDNGTPFGAPYAANQQIGDIRFGAFDFGSSNAGIGFPPPPNGGTTLEGDVILNSNPFISYYVAPGNQGDPYNLYPPGGGLYRNDFQGLVAHEIGHALGMGHSTDPGALMCGYVNANFDGSQCAYADPNHTGQAPINRIPGSDDIAGIQHLYGVAPVPIPDSWILMLSGLALIAWRLRRQPSTGTLRRAPRPDVLSPAG